jgi:haloalkane dehalogenase
VNKIMTSTEDNPRSGTGARIKAALWSGYCSSVVTVLLATIAVEAIPRPRGITFLLPLRLATLAPLCAIVSVAIALLYETAHSKLARPRLMLTIVLGGFASVYMFVLHKSVDHILSTASVPVLTVAVCVALFVPRFFHKPLRSRGATIAIIVLGLVEIVGVVGALSSERAVYSETKTPDFEIPRRMFDADSKFVDLPSGARVHYFDVGTGQTLLFLHGNPAWSFQWRTLVGGLKGSFRCVALDYPGFGLSTAPPGYGFTPREQSKVVEEFVDRLGLHDITFVMQDWGGPIGLGLAGRRPELVRSVVFGNTWAWQTSTSEVRGKFSKIAGGPLGEFVQMNFNAFPAFAIRNGVRRKLPDEIVEMYSRPFRPLNRRGVAVFYPGQITAASDYMAEVEAGLSRIGDRKALIFWGMRDPGFPPVDMKRFEKVFPNHKTIEFTKADHFFFEDENDTMLSEIRAFMARDTDAHEVHLSHKKGGADRARSSVCKSASSPCNGS